MYADPIYSGTKGQLFSLALNSTSTYMILSLVSSTIHICGATSFTCCSSWDNTFAGGVVLFTRSLALYKRQGIRVNVLCPEVIIFGFLEFQVPVRRKCFTYLFSHLWMDILD